jgi:N-glycosylase/DNA lyase
VGKTRRQLTPAAWSDWQPFPDWSPSPAVLAETLDGGQSFGWWREAGPDDQPLWTGRWLEQLVQLQLRAGALHWRTHPGRVNAAEPALRHYLGREVDWPALTDSLPWRSDPHLLACLQAFPGLRILRQPFGETLLGFLCSATKQIVQIKQMLALVAERHGSPLAPSSIRHRLPTWAELAGVPEADLRGCLLGFRARYIHETAHYLAAHPGWLEETELLPYPAAKARLVELPGVGEKVADCVLLFGAGRLEAFPVDTWILRALARHYGLEGWKPAQVAQFGRAHFGPRAGLAQQFLFAWERAHGVR